MGGPTGGRKALTRALSRPMGEGVWAEHDFHSERAIEFAVAHFVNDTHAAAGDFPLQRVAVAGGNAAGFGRRLGCRVNHRGLLVLSDQLVIVER